MGGRRDVRGWRHTAGRTTGFFYGRPDSTSIEVDARRSQVLSPVGDEALKNELIAARRNWIAKKKLADDVSTAHARAEYQASQDGTKVDPALTERQRLAREEAAQAHQAMQPLVERARKAGFAPKTLELYEQNSQGY